MIMVPGDTIIGGRPGFPRSGARAPAAADAGAAPALPLHEARDRFERDYILRTLAEQQGNMSRTAEVLGVERSNLYRKMRAFGIAPRRGRVEGRRRGGLSQRPAVAQAVLENLIGTEARELQIARSAAWTSAAAGTSPMISLSSTDTPYRAASRLTASNTPEDRRLLVVRQVHRYLDDARDAEREPGALTYRKPPLLSRMAAAIFFATSSRSVSRLML